MNGTPGGIITAGTRLCFDGGLWEVTELTASAVVLRDALDGLRQASISETAVRDRLWRPDQMIININDLSLRGAAVTDRLIRITTALAVVTVACVAAIISYEHAYELVSTHGEHGLTARLLPFTVDGQRIHWASPRSRSKR